MKIDILVPIGEKGGVENVINMVAPFLMQQGMKVRVVQLVSSNVEWTAKGIPYYTLLEGLENHTVAEFIQVYAEFLQKKGMPDCILATSWPMMCYVARRVVEYFESKTTIISWLHAPVERYEAAGYGSYEQLAFADAHLAISQMIYNEIESNIANSKILPVYNPVDLNTCQEKRHQRIDRKNRKLYYVGRISEEKRIDVIVQAIASVGDTWELYLIGDDNNSYGESMKKLAKACGIENKVHWLGWQTNPWSKVEDAEAVVLASEYEGFPLVAIEAQACGLPVIATPVSGIEDFITDGENGFLFPFGDWKKLSVILKDIETGKLPLPDSEICQQHAMPFEKTRAVTDFYCKLSGLIGDFQKSICDIAQQQHAENRKQEKGHMTRQQIYSTNILLQSMIDKLVHACHIQNYDYVVRQFTTLTENLMLVLDAVFTDISFYNQEMEIVNPEAISLALEDILTAQDNKDYVLMADLLELRLLPFLQSLQEMIRAYDASGTNPEVWERNMGALKQRDEQLWEQLKHYHERYEKENAAGTWTGTHHLEDTNSGAFTMAGQDDKGMYYYHSNVSPLKEAADFAAYYYDKGCSSYIVWGLGLGYHIQEMFSLDNGITLQVFESDMDVIYHCFMATDLSAIILLPGFSLIYDSDFKKVITTLNESTPNFIIHNPSLRHIPDERIREQMEMFFIRDSGKRNAAVLFETNSRENFKNYDGYVDELKPQFQGKDVIIVAAGPSLDKNVQQLKNKKPDTIILAVETVFRKLLALGIDVDYMIVTDANDRVYSHIAGLENQTIPMLYLSTAYRDFAKNYQGKKYLICQNGYDKAEDLAKRNGWQLYETGGSVSTTALDVCIRLGCKRIAFIGLDLAYTGNLAHATGTARRDVDVETDMKQVPAIGGGTVPASRLFMIYNRWIAERVKKSDVSMPVVDATEGGAIVPGLEVMSLVEFMM